MRNAFYIAAYGCKVNQYECQAIREAWSNGGGVETYHPEDAAVILIYSCAVTAKAVAEARTAARRYHALAPHARLVIAGCAAQTFHTEFTRLPGVSLIVRLPEKSCLNQVFFQLVDKKADVPLAPSDMRQTDAGGWLPFSISAYPRSRAVIKVQDGCSHGCAYCIVPQARGISVSRPPEEVVREVERLAKKGFREFVLSGINLRQYGSTLSPKIDFWDLVAVLEGHFAPKWAGQMRFRMSSLEPGQLNAKALECIRQSRLLCPHLHISLQSGSHSVLRRMGRGHYKPEALFDFFRKLRDIWPVFAAGADILVGFPGETEREFEETLEYCALLDLTYGHVFPFSARPNTLAASLKNHIPRKERVRRAGQIRRVLDGKKQDFLSGLCALPQLEVAVEGMDEITGHARGITQFYAECQFPASGGSIARGSLCRVQPVAHEGGVLRGKMIERSSSPGSEA